MQPSDVRRVKGVLFVLFLLPALRLLHGAFFDGLGANPLEFITRNSGDWCLYFLTLGLAITPLRHALGWQWLLPLRRMIGLYAFFYACLHFTAFFWFDHFFDLQEMLQDAAKRPFILLGLLAFVLLIPLAASSNRWAIRKLGRRWQQLHRLVYLIAVLALWHYWWMKAGKNDFAQPALFIALIGALLAARLWRARSRQNAPPAQAGRAQ
ncbi:protein-methionine-sulfoxide reductase heme-binding subunit MsrQ [Massilia sp. W12]|uniref:sulfite oxidase heme-binding subunit YedZ n=1 Tax=Massilia sp. W12 TaxID=3126507 RepID=UPI0030CF3E3F